MYTPVNPSFTIWKWDLRGQHYIGMFSWCVDDINKRTLMRMVRISAHRQDVERSWPHGEVLRPWLSKVCQIRTERIARVRSDLGLSWAHMSKGLFLTLLLKCMLCLYRNNEIVMILIMCSNYGDCTPCIMVHDCWISVLSYCWHTSSWWTT